MERYLETARLFDFRHLLYGLKVVRNWIMISVVTHAFLLWKYCIPYCLEGLDNFQKYRGILLFLITTGLHAFEDTKNATVSRSFDFLLFLRFLVFCWPSIWKSFIKESWFIHVPDIISRIALNNFWKSFYSSLDVSYSYIPFFFNYFCVS